MSAKTSRQRAAARPAQAPMQLECSTCNIGPPPWHTHTPRTQTRTPPGRMGLRPGLSDRALRGSRPSRTAPMAHTQPQSPHKQAQQPRRWAADDALESARAHAADTARDARMPVGGGMRASAGLGHAFACVRECGRASAVSRLVSCVELWVWAIRGRAQGSIMEAWHGCRSLSCRPRQ